MKARTQSLKKMPRAPKQESRANKRAKARRKAMQKARRVRRS